MSHATSGRRRYLNRYGVITVVSYDEPLLDADESLFDGYTP